MPNFKPQDTNFEARVRTSFARQTAMATLNIEIAALDAGEVELKMPYSAAYAQQHGFIHAGISDKPVFCARSLSTPGPTACLDLVGLNGLIRTHRDRGIRRLGLAILPEGVEQRRVRQALAWFHWRPREPRATIYVPS